MTPADPGAQRPGEAERGMAGTVDTTLVLSFEPQAVRDHFDGDGSPEAHWVEQATDAQLVQVGRSCLAAGSLYAMFHEQLVENVCDVMAGAAR